MKERMEDDNILYELFVRIFSSSLIGNFIDKAIESVYKLLFAYYSMQL